MTNYCGISDPAKDRGGGLTFKAKIGPVAGAPSPPGGQMGASNKRLRNAVSQGDAGAGCFKGIWADPKGRGGKSHCK